MADIPLDALVSGGGDGVTLSGLQPSFAFAANSASPADITTTYSITTTLAQAFSVSAPTGRRILLEQIYVPLGLSTSQALTLELEIDGVVIISETFAPSSGSVTFLGSTPSVNQLRFKVNSEFKMRIKTATTTQSNIQFRYRYYLI